MLFQENILTVAQRTGSEQMRALMLLGYRLTQKRCTSTEWVK
jgi:hypothetical protein